MVLTFLVKKYFFGSLKKLQVVGPLQMSINGQVNRSLVYLFSSINTVCNNVCMQLKSCFTTIMMSFEHMWPCANQDMLMQTYLFCSSGIMDKFMVILQSLGVLSCILCCKLCSGESVLSYTSCRGEDAFFQCQLSVIVFKKCDNDKCISMKINLSLIFILKRQLIEVFIMLLYIMHVISN